MTEWGARTSGDSEYKKAVLNRLIKARNEGISTGVIAKKSGGDVGIHTIYDMLEAKALPFRVWEMVDKGLKELGY